ncbi:MAG: hypothetical protein HZB65_02145 [Candidatus Aenigmarchaeota archaeon]|nr:hypothetical protein [Candidatus Aenigmarchaeota archaeon]
MNFKSFTKLFEKSDKRGIANEQTPFRLEDTSNEINERYRNENLIQTLVETRDDFENRVLRIECKSEEDRVEAWLKRYKYPKERVMKIYTPDEITKTIEYFNRLLEQFRAKEEYQYFEEKRKEIDEIHKPFLEEYKHLEREDEAFGKKYLYPYEYIVEKTRETILSIKRKYDQEKLDKLYKEAELLANKANDFYNRYEEIYRIVMTTLDNKEEHFKKLPYTQTPENIKIIKEAHRLLERSYKARGIARGFVSLITWVNIDISPTSLCEGLEALLEYLEKKEKKEQ